MWDSSIIVVVVKAWFIDGLDGVVIDKLVDLLFDVSVGVLNIMLVVTAAIDLEFALGVASDVNVLTAVWAVIITGVVIDNAVDVSVDMDVNSLTGVVTLLELVLSSPSKEAIPLC